MSESFQAGEGKDADALLVTRPHHKGAVVVVMGRKPELNNQALLVVDALDPDQTHRLQSVASIALL